MKKLQNRKKNKEDLKNIYSFYHSDSEIEKEKYFQIPYALINKENFPELKFEEAALYGLLRDKISLSINQVDRFKDEEGRNYILYKQEDLARDTSFARRTLQNYLSSLEKADLIMIKKSKNQFVNQNHIYVKRYEDKLKYNEEKQATDSFFYTENELEQHASIRVPFKLVKDKQFKNISFTEKCLYGLLLDRLKLSQKNKERYSDETGNIYMIYTQQQLAEKMHKSEKTIRTMLKNLENEGLILRKKICLEGKGKCADRIYLLNINKDIRKPAPVNLLYRDRPKRLKPLKTYRMCKIYRTECADFTGRNVQNLPDGMCRFYRTESADFTGRNVQILPDQTGKNYLSESADFTVSNVQNLPTNTTEINTTDRILLTHSSELSEWVSEEPSVYFSNEKVTQEERELKNYLDHISPKNLQLSLGTYHNVLLRETELKQLYAIYGKEVLHILNEASKIIFARSETADVIRNYYPYVCKIAEKTGILTIEQKKETLAKKRKEKEAAEEERRINIDLYGTDDQDVIDEINKQAVSKSIETWLSKHPLM